MTFIYSENGGKNLDNIVVYVIQLFNSRIEIKHDSCEEMFMWLYKKTGSKSFRDALEIAWMSEDLLPEEKGRLKMLKRLYTCCIDGLIKPKVNIFCLYEDIAELMSAGLITE
ncbi:MAG: hypothetical protein IBX72_11265 [Nitrospirae bacterium]|nr:hypothetical protein [Nitrospirota bacterium]